MSKSFTILVTASPQKSQAHLTALKFAKTLAEQNSPIRSVFFYQDAVLVANGYAMPPSDEPQLAALWTSFARQYDIELQTCVAACLRRGVVDEHEAKENKLGSANLNTGFTVVGLGQLAATLGETNTQLVHFK